MRPRWRKMTWLILGFTVLMAAWIAAAVATNGDVDCSTAANPAACETGADIGTGLGVTALFCFWFLGFAVLAPIWFMTKPSRVCPRCGSGVKRGRTTCKTCGFDFAANAAGVPQPAP